MAALKIFPHPMQLLELVRAIEQHRGRRPRSYTSWCIGTTTDPDATQASVERFLDAGTREWLCLPAETMADAQAIDDHFRDLGMNNGYGRKPPGRFVFVYYNRFV
jgi:hypothetical protein